MGSYLLTFASAASAPSPLVANVSTVALPLCSSYSSASTALIVILLPESAVGAQHGVHGRLGQTAELARIAGRGQRRPRVHRASRQAGIAEGRQAVAELMDIRHLGAELGLDEVDLLVVVLLQGGTVPAAGTELVLTLVDGMDRAQADTVHEPGVLLAELHLEKKTCWIYCCHF